MGAFIDEGFTLGHEPIGIVEAVGAEVPNLAVGDRVVVPFNIACGSCWMCRRGLQSQCETTQCCYDGTEYGAALFGYTRIYGNVPGAQAEYLRVPQAHYGPIKVPEGPADDRYLFLSDVLPTAWQAVQNCGAVEGQTVAIIGLGPIGDMSCRVAFQRGAAKVFGIDLVPERLARAAGYGSTPSTCSPTTTSAGASGRSPRGAGRTRSSTPSAWRPTARRSVVPRSGWPAFCPTGCRSG